MALRLCGCGKRSRRSSVYVASAIDADELSLRPPSENRTRRTGEHVETYLAATAVTVSVRQQHRHHRHRHQHQQQKQQQQQQQQEKQHCDDDNDVKRQLSEYDSVLDDYLHAVIATQDADVSRQVQPKTL